jgi:hypothetical protein
MKIETNVQVHNILVPRSCVLEWACDTRKKKRKETKTKSCYVVIATAVRGIDRIVREHRQGQFQVRLGQPCAAHVFPDGGHVTIQSS